MSSSPTKIVSAPAAPSKCQYFSEEDAADEEDDEDLVVGSQGCALR